MDGVTPEEVPDEGQSLRVDQDGADEGAEEQEYPVQLAHKAQDREEVPAHHDKQETQEEEGTALNLSRPREEGDGVLEPHECDDTHQERDLA